MICKIAVVELIASHMPELGEVPVNPHTHAAVRPEQIQITDEKLRVRRGEFSRSHFGSTGIKPKSAWLQGVFFPSLIKAS